jgi:hypothetical protein
VPDAASGGTAEAARVHQAQSPHDAARRPGRRRNRPARRRSAAA